MIKRTITFEDYDGNKRSVEYHFNLNEAEITKLSFGFEGGIENYVKNAVASENMGEVFNMFEKVIIAAVGIKSADGLYLDKSDEVKKRFVQSPAFNTLLLELTENETAATDFIKALAPKKVNAVPAPEAN